jgi:hypothetical protein
MLEHLQPLPRRGLDSPFFIRMAKNGSIMATVQSWPRFLVFVQIWAFIHPVSPGHPRPPGARSGSSEETNARETPRKVHARLVALTCRRERSIVVLIALSSVRYKSLPLTDV